jgi:hypothetical protein
MDHREIRLRRVRNSDVRNPLRRRRQGGEKSERQVANRVAEFRTLVTVPGINRVEAFQRCGAAAFDHAHQIQPRIGDGADAIGKTNQRYHGPGRPHLRVVRAGSFESGQRQNHVADSPGANQQPLHYLSPYNLRALSRSTIRASSAARLRVISPSASMPVSAIPNAARPACAEM